ncbi:MAG: phosphoribosylanthranilate isomerase [Chloroflexi bacterium]|nr:phosphoribosylanthranilate isomerase [Chloroflexota bacterium]
MTLVKVCGIGSVEDGRAALDAGADLLGFIFWRPGKRYVPPTEAARIVDALRAHGRTWSAVGVFVDPEPSEVEAAARLCDLDYVQLSGNETPELVRHVQQRTIKAVHVRPDKEAQAAQDVERNAFGADMYLLDTHAEAMPGGTGVPFEWPALRAVGSNCLVAGGLRPDNVTRALETLLPLGVDVSSGVEFSESDGRRRQRKDPRLINEFMEAVRSYDARLG